jgi:hypothetical protein
MWQIDHQIESVFTIVSGYQSGHQTLDEVQQYVNDHPNYKVFCIVRNIFDRMVSIYHYTKQNHILIGHEDIKKMSFEEYIQSLKDGNNFFNQTVYIKSDHAQIPHILHFNNLKIELRNFLETVGVPHGLLDKLNFNSVINGSNHTGYREYYTESSIDNVRKMYSDDISFFGDDASIADF